MSIFATTRMLNDHECDVILFESIMSFNYRKLRHYPEYSTHLKFKIEILVQTIVSLNI